MYYEKLELSCRILLHQVSDFVKLKVSNGIKLQLASTLSSHNIKNASYITTNGILH